MFMSMTNIPLYHRSDFKSMSPEKFLPEYHPFKRELGMKRLNEHSDMNAGMDVSAVLKKNADLQRRIQNLEHLSSVGEMATHLLHDIRQPLSAVHAGVDSLATLDLSADERSEIAEIVQLELQRFSSMVQDIME